MWMWIIDDAANSSIENVWWKMGGIFASSFIHTQTHHTLMYTHVGFGAFRVCFACVFRSRALCVDGELKYHGASLYTVVVITNSHHISASPSPTFEYCSKPPPSAIQLWFGGQPVSISCFLSLVVLVFAINHLKTKIFYVNKSAKHEVRLPIKFTQNVFACCLW